MVWIAKHANHDQQTHRSNYGKGLVIVPEYVSVLGKAAYDLTAPIHEILVRDDPNYPVYFNRGVRQAVAKKLDPYNTGQLPRLMFNPHGAQRIGPYRPLYDLVLQPTTGLTKVLKSSLVQERLKLADYNDESEYYSEIIKSNDEKRYTFSVLYKASDPTDPIEDAHRDWATGDDLQTTQWDYVRKGDRSIFLQHKRSPYGFEKAGEWVDIATLPFPVEGEFKSVNGRVEKRTIPANSVWLGVVWQPWSWDLIKSGEVNGFSWGGRAQRLTSD